MSVIDLPRDFTDTPGGRYRDDGPFSGQEFREDFLEPRFLDASDEAITVILDGAYGYATSFLEEAFGGLARKFDKRLVSKRLKFICREEPLLEKEIRSYIEAA